MKLLIAIWRLKNSHLFNDRIPIDQNHSEALIKLFNFESTNQRSSFLITLGIDIAIEKSQRRRSPFDRI